MSVDIQIKLVGVLTYHLSQAAANQDPHTPASSLSQLSLSGLSGACPSWSLDRQGGANTSTPALSLLQNAGTTSSLHFHPPEKSGLIFKRNLVRRSERKSYDNM